MEGCPLKTAMILICDCWKVTLIQALLDANSSLRYSELRDAAGEVSDRTHTRQLRELTDDGLVICEVYPEFPAARGVRAYAHRAAARADYRRASDLGRLRL